MRDIRIVTIFCALFLSSLAFASRPPSPHFTNDPNSMLNPDTFYYMGNKWITNLFINIEPGYAEVSSIGADWWSAQWKFVPEDGYFKIQNRWDSSSFLHIEFGSIESGPIQPYWHSAQWIMTPAGSTSPGSGGTFHIQNRWNPSLFLNIESGFLEASEIQSGWWSALWEVSP